MRQSMRVMSFLILLLGWSGLAGAARVEFSQLASPNVPPLPYGEPIVIYGTLDDIHVGLNEPVTDWIEITNLEVRYSAESAADGTATAFIRDKQWTATLTPLPISSYVHITLSAKGSITPSRLDRIVDSILDSPRIRDARIEFEAAAYGQPLLIQQAAYDRFSSTVRAIVYETLDNASIQLVDPRRAASPLQSQAADDLSEAFNALFNLDEFRRTAVNAGVVSAEDSFSAAYEKTSAYQVPAQNVANCDLVRECRVSDRYNKAYARVHRAIRAEIKDELTAEVSVVAEAQASALVQDLQRYAGLDIGTLYSPGAEELRSFMLVNIYFGAVDDKPLPLSTNQWLRTLQTRASLTVGYDLGDMSDNQDSDIDGDNAYALGLGFRLNKYFRLSGGKMYYRSKDSGRIEDDGFAAISLDITAFKALQSLVTKAP